MTTNQQLSFLQEKIHEIGSAIFFNLSNSVLKLPTTVISILKVDDFGFIWFFMQKPKQHLTEFDPEFPVRLDFFKKGSTFFLQVTGKGWVVADPEEMNSLEVLPEEARQAAMGDLVLVKVKILRAEYHEARSQQRQSVWQNTMNLFTAWFRQPAPVRTDTYFPAS